METSGNRIQQLLDEYRWKQVDLINKCKPVADQLGAKMFTKSQLCDWLHNRYQPSQIYLTILGMALNISEAWLLGFDVERERTTASVQAEQDFMLLEKYNKLSNPNKTVVLNLIDSLLATQR